MAKKRLHDMVVVLPGITGSTLRKDGRDLWAISGQGAWRALTSLGGDLQDLRLQEDDPLSAFELAPRTMASLTPSHLIGSATLVQICCWHRGAFVAQGTEKVLQRLIGLDDDICQIVVALIIRRRGTWGFVPRLCLNANQFVILPHRRAI